MTQIGRSLAVVAVLSLLLVPPSDVAAQEVLPTDCAGAHLEPSSGDEPDSNGGVTPVVLIHGITGEAEVFREDVNGTIDPDERPIGQSVAHQVDLIPGAVSYTFDYHDDSLKWVTAPEIGERFGAAIDCLYDAFGTPVVVVAHSMGGLATRWVANSSRSTGPRRGQIGLVVTLGTPDEGSDLLAFGRAALNQPNAISQVLKVIFHLCGAYATVDADACGIVGVPGSDAGAALATGSDELAELRPWPDEIEVVGLAGSIVLHDLGSLGIFNAQIAPGSIDIGDIAVPTQSALAGSDRTRKWTCNYTLSVAPKRSANILDYIGFKAVGDTASLILSVFRSPCYHSNLVTTVEIHKEVIESINNYLLAHPAPQTQTVTTPVVVTTQSPQPTTTGVASSSDEFCAVLQAEQERIIRALLPNEDVINPTLAQWQETFVALATTPEELRAYFRALAEVAPPEIKEDAVLVSDKIDDTALNVLNIALGIGEIGEAGAAMNEYAEQNCGRGI